ncbi:MATE family efflux transporter [Streptomyces halstedii]|uniref:MATE family efflux transporter n=1 Tax=Streptomyces halstedii TaxID=1944 RepID=A0ABS6TWN3_STRHA|nr:MATE family efflux transporter [Streptomyces halstedii]MBV7672678.1 MATE family efflux transporter [Streptomyces halstedii]
MNHAAQTTRDTAATLGTRPVGRVLWENCTQTTASVGLYGVYALTNAWFVAQGAGPDAVAAVNLVAPLLLIMGAVSSTVGAGGASLVSRALGAGDPRAAARAAGNAFTLFWVTAATTTLAGLLALDPLLSVLGAHGDIRAPAHDYAAILLAGALVSTGFSSLVRAEGRMRFSTLLWLIPVAVQITLDPLLVFGLHQGVRGAALGTVAGQAVSAGMSLWFFFAQRRRPYRITAADLRPHGPTVRALVGIGAPSFLAGVGATFLALVVNTTLTAYGTATALAAYAVCARLQTFAAMPHLGIGQGLQPVVGYNVGLGESARVHRARRLALRATLLYGAAIALILVACAGPLVGLFLHGPAAGTATWALRLIAPGLVCAGVTPVVSSYFQATGRPRPSYLLSVGTLAGLKMPLAAALGCLGTTGLWIALSLGELLSAAAALLVLRQQLAHTAPVPHPKQQ